MMEYLESPSGEILGYAFLLVGFSDIVIAHMFFGVRMSDVEREKRKQSQSICRLLQASGVCVMGLGAAALVIHHGLY